MIFGNVMDLMIGFIAGAVFAGVIAWTWPRWPRNQGAGRSGSLSESYGHGVAMLADMQARSGDGSDASAPAGNIKDAILPFLAACGRATGEVPKFDDLTPTEQRVIGLCQRARVMNRSAFQHSVTRMREEERNIVEEARAIFDLSDDEVRHRIQETLGSLAARPVAAAASVPELANDDLSAPQTVTESSTDPIVTVPVSDILDLISTSGSEPDLWHVLVGGLDIEDSEVSAIVLWILDQPNCDRATAAAALVRAGAADLMRFDSADACPPELSGNWEVAEAVCRRAEEDGFTHSDLNLQSIGLDDNQHPYLLNMAAAAGDMLDRGEIPVWPLPEALLGSPFEGRAPGVPYRVIDGELALVDVTTTTDPDSGNGSGEAKAA